MEEILRLNVPRESPMPTVKIEKAQFTFPAII
jgi:hypothetical protein